jgi:2,4-dienoyl-CoA reductase-like NADH-dependent reductase (Old Yellow Enzyme family)/thioredoxin reductase
MPYSHLFSPINIGPLTARNRLLMSAMSINFGVDERGRISDQLTAYLAARARGGTGMILVGGGGVHPSGVELPNLPALWRDDCIPALRRMAGEVQRHEALCGMQIMHGGRQSYHDHTVAPSAIAAPAVVKSVPKALSVAAIGELTEAFAAAAWRCQEGGLDFVEIHAAHGYLINQFFSPNANRRSDRYGGSFDNRIRFMLEVLDAIRARVGPDFAVGVRINGEDYIDNGWTLADARRLAPILEAHGAAYLSVSAGVYGSSQLTIPSMYVQPGCFVPLAQAVKETVSIPVVTAGRIKEPDLAEAVIAEGKADLVAMGRPLLADPDLALKAKRGASTTIRPCIGCCLACIHAVLALEPGSCVVNPDVGREALLDNAKAVRIPKRVLVVGGGPGGMAAARVAAMRGHQVTLCESQPALGGAARLAALPPGRDDIGAFIEFQERELRRLGVQVRLKTPLSVALLAVVKPQSVIIATGSLTEAPLLKGLFTTPMQVVSAEEIIAGTEKAGRRVVVLGGDQIGLLTADFLAEAGGEVVVLHRGRHFAEALSSNDRYYLRERLKQGRVALHKKAVIQAVLDNGVRVKIDGNIKTFSGFDTIVLADKRTPLRKALELLKDANIDLHVVGDARSPRTLQFAISEAEEAARAV